MRVWSVAFTTMMFLETACGQEAIGCDEPSAAKCKITRTSFTAAPIQCPDDRACRIVCRGTGVCQYTAIYGGIGDWDVKLLCAGESACQNAQLTIYGTGHARVTVHCSSDNAPTGACKTLELNAADSTWLSLTATGYKAARDLTLHCGTSGGACSVAGSGQYVFYGMTINAADSSKLTVAAQGSSALQGANINCPDSALSGECLFQLTTTATSTSPVVALNNVITGDTDAVKFECEGSKTDMFFATYESWGSLEGNDCYAPYAAGVNSFSCGPSGSFYQICGTPAVSDVIPAFYVSTDTFTGSWAAAQTFCETSCSANLARYARALMTVLDQSPNAPHSLQHPQR